LDNEEDGEEGYDSQDAEDYGVEDYGAEYHEWNAYYDWIADGLSGADGFVGGCKWDGLRYGWSAHAYVPGFLSRASPQESLLDLALSCQIAQLHSNREGKTIRLPEYA
jgi:hypothetical protein